MALSDEVRGSAGQYARRAGRIWHTAETVIRGTIRGPSLLHRVKQACFCDRLAWSTAAPRLPLKEAEVVGTGDGRPRVVRPARKCDRTPPAIAHTVLGLWAMRYESSRVTARGIKGTVRASPPSSPLVFMRIMNAPAPVSRPARFIICTKSDGTVWAWGRNDAGQLGDGTLVERDSPVQVVGLSHVVAVAARAKHNMPGMCCSRRNFGKHVAPGCTSPGWRHLRRFRIWHGRRRTRLASSGV